MHIIDGAVAEIDVRGPSCVTNTDIRIMGTCESQIVGNANIRIVGPSENQSIELLILDLWVQVKIKMLGLLMWIYCWVQ